MKILVELRIFILNLSFTSKPLFYQKSCSLFYKSIKAFILSKKLLFILQEVLTHGFRSKTISMACSTCKNFNPNGAKVEDAPDPRRPRAKP
jgi:hypothetical protein